MSKWVGYAVSVNCGEPLGCYQGTILEADGTTITLTKAFRNGFPYPKSQVTLNAADIQDLKIIEARPEPAEQTHSTVPVTKSSKKSHRSTVCENLQANTSSTSNQAAANTVASSSKGGQPSNKVATAAPARSKPIEIQGGRINKNNHAGSFGNTGSTPKGRGACGGGAGGCSSGAEKARRRNEACFGLAAAAVDDDFDFEGNLALFDKRALWESMRHTKPDLVRHADDGDAKMRHDENVMGGARTRRAAVAEVAEGVRGRRLYEADDGLLLPSITHAARRALYDGLDRLGLGGAARAMVARAAGDVALRLVGGGRRLDPSNAHQAPCIVGVVGRHGGGATGACCLRLLLAHGARVALHVAGPDTGASTGCGASATATAALARELDALALDGVRAQPLAALPAPDLVLLALDDPQLDPADADTAADQYSEAVWWVRGARAVVVGVEGAAGVACRARVLGGWPADPAGPAAWGAADPEGGRLYACVLAEPQALSRRLNLPRLGAAAAGLAALPLHPAPPRARHDAGGRD